MINNCTHMPMVQLDRSREVVTQIDELCFTERDQVMA